jgi:hypothetical protein
MPQHRQSVNFSIPNPCTSKAQSMLVDTYLHISTFIEKYNSYILMMWEFKWNVIMEVSCFHSLQVEKWNHMYEACINYFALLYLFFFKKFIYFSLLHFWGLKRLNIKNFMIAFHCSYLLFSFFYHLSGDVVALLKQTQSHVHWYEMH